MTLLTRGHTMAKFGQNTNRDASSPQTTTPLAEEEMQRVGEILEREHLSRNSVARDLGITRDELVEQINRNADLRLSQLYAWHKIIIDVPLGELLPEEHQPDKNNTFDESAVTERIAVINAIKSLKAIIAVLESSDEIKSENTMELQIISERLSESLQPLERRLQIEQKNRPAEMNGVELSEDSLHRIDFYLGKHPEEPSVIFKAVAEKLGISQTAAEQHAHPGSDLLLSELYVWAEVLGEPVMNLLIQSVPFQQKTTTLFLTERKAIEGLLLQARTLQNNLEEHITNREDLQMWQRTRDAVRKEAAEVLRVIDTIFDLDSDDVSTWPRRGQVRTTTEGSRREETMLSATLLPDQEPRD